MNTHEITPLDITFQESLLQSEIVWDFKLSPHLFPLYLFRHFANKYCTSSKAGLFKIDCFDINSAVLHCNKDLPLGTEYSAWLLITRVWETAMSFSLMFGQRDFIPFKKSNRDCLVQVGLSVYTFQEINQTTIDPWNSIRTQDFTSLEISHTFMFEIKEIMKQFNIEYTKE